METLLLHEDLVKGGAQFFTDVCTMLKNEGVSATTGLFLAIIMLRQMWSTVGNALSAASIT
jgi:limonene-1,2-epoxide hydrolase